MAFFVDELKDHPKSVTTPAAHRYGSRWCHLWTDGPIEELHVFAESIGLLRGWFQKSRWLPHYDLVPTKRIRAIMAGAVVGDIKSAVKAAYRKTNNMPPGVRRPAKRSV